MDEILHIAQPEETPKAREKGRERDKTPKSAPEHAPLRAMEKIMGAIFFLCGIIAIVFVLFISVYLIISGLPAIREIGLIDFLFGTKWASTAAEP